MEKRNADALESRAIVSEGVERGISGSSWFFFAYLNEKVVPLVDNGGLRTSTHSKYYTRQCAEEGRKSALRH